MTSADYNLNRPVYLGRRDVFMERAMELFHQCLKETSVKKRLSLINATLYYLQSALEPAMMAAKSERANPLEESLILFLRLVVCYLHSARAMMENESQLENTQSPLWQFLHRNLPAAAAPPPAATAMRAGQALQGGGKMDTPQRFARSSEQLLQDVSHLFRMAEEPFQDLRTKLIEAMTDDERRRYTRAYENLKEHSQSLDHTQHAGHMRPNFLANS